MSLLNSSDDQTITHKDTPNTYDVETLIRENRMKDTALHKASDLIDLLQQQLDSVKNMQSQSMSHLQHTLRIQYQVEIEQLRIRIQVLERELQRKNMEKERLSSQKKTTIMRNGSSKSLSQSKEKPSIASSRLIKGQREQSRHNTILLPQPSRSSKNLFSQRFSIQKQYCAIKLLELQSGQSIWKNALEEIIATEVEQSLNVANAFVLAKQECLDFFEQNQDVIHCLSARSQPRTRSQKHSRRNIMNSKTTSIQLQQLTNKQFSKEQQLFELLLNQQKLIIGMKEYQQELEQIIQEFLISLKTPQQRSGSPTKLKQILDKNDNSGFHFLGNSHNNAWKSTSPPTVENIVKQSEYSKGQKHYSQKKNSNLKWIESFQQKIVFCLRSAKRQYKSTIREIQEQNRQLKFILDQLVSIIKKEQQVNFKALEPYCGSNSRKIN